MYCDVGLSFIKFKTFLNVGQIKQILNLNLIDIIRWSIIFCRLIRGPKFDFFFIIIKIIMYIYLKTDIS